MFNVPQMVDLQPRMWIPAAEHAYTYADTAAHMHSSLFSQEQLSYMQFCGDARRDREQGSSNERLGMLRLHTYVFVFLWIDDGVTRGKHPVGVCELGAPELGVVLW